MLRWALASACAIVLVICATLVRYEFCFTDSKATDKGASGTGAGGQDANDTRAAAAAPLGGAVHKMRHAVLLAGDRLHALRYTGISLRRYVLDRLGDQDIVDVFLVGTPMSDADAFFVRELLAPRLVYFVMREQMADESLAAVFYRDNNRTQFWEYKCVGGKGGLHNMWWLQEAYRLVQAHENATGITYDWMHSLRPDLQWLAPMPPMSVFNHTRLYMATRQCWGGVPGGIIHCPRSVCGFYLELFSCMSHGECTNLMRGHGHSQCVPIVERDIMLLLRYGNVRLGYYNNVANLICMPNLCKAGKDKCTAPHLCRDNARFKYRGWDHYYEAELAVFNARYVHRVGWRREYAGWRFIHDNSRWPVDHVEAQDHYLERNPLLKAELHAMT